MIRLSACLLCLLLAMPVAAKERFQQPAPVHLDKQGDKWARASLNKMSLEQKIGQMFMIWAFARFTNFTDPQYIGLRDTMRKYHIGGFALTVSLDDGLLEKTPPLEAAMLTNQLQRDSEFPLLFAADFERGLAYRLVGVTNFPHEMAFGATRDPKYAREYGRITAQEARAIGVQWNWFPDADVNSNPLNPIINTRSFGEDPKQVSDMVAANIAGAREFGLLTTAKHFPGHGDTSTDSHLSVPVVNADRAQLDSIDLPPFRAAIAAGVDAVMVAHLRVPALDPDPNHVATISPAIVTGLLKQQMGFKGLVVTDALIMSGLMKLFPEGGSAAAGRAAVEAVKAGDDVLIIPSDLNGSYTGLLNAVRSGEIPESRINESVLKILRAKAAVGLNKARLVDIEQVSRIVAKPENLAIAQEVADEAVTLVRDNHKVLPLKAAVNGTNSPQPAYHPTAENRGRTLLLIFTPDMRTDAGWVLDRQMRARIPDVKTIYIDPKNAAVWMQAVVDAVNQAQTVIAAVYLSPQGGAPSNMAALSNGPEGLLHTVVESAASKTVVVAMGNPYFASRMPLLENYLCTFSDAQVSELSAVKAMFGEIPTSGRLPVTIPGIAARGFGLTMSSGGQE
jgi:beta-N-acetylhexosaminidase